VARGPRQRGLRTFVAGRSPGGPAAGRAPGSGWTARRRASPRSRPKGDVTCVRDAPASHRTATQPGGRALLW